MEKDTQERQDRSLLKQAISMSGRLTLPVCFWLWWNTFLAEGEKRAFFAKGEEEDIAFSGISLGRIAAASRIHLSCRPVTTRVDSTGEMVDPKENANIDAGLGGLSQDWSRSGVVHFVDFKQP